MNERLKLVPIHKDEMAQDTPNWNAGKDGKYLMKFRYDALNPLAEMSFPRQKIWIKGVMPKVSYFLRLAFINRVSTLDNVHKRKMSMSNRYILYKESEEQWTTYG